MTTTEPGAANTQQPTDRPAAVWSIRPHAWNTEISEVHNLITKKWYSTHRTDADDLAAELNRYETETAALRDELERANAHLERLTMENIGSQNNFHNTLLVNTQLRAENERLRSGLSADELEKFMKWFNDVECDYDFSQDTFYEWKTSDCVNGIEPSEVIAAFKKYGGNNGK